MSFELAGGPYAVTAGSTLTFRGSATDPSSVDTAAGFAYTWDFGDGSPKASGLSLSAPSHTYAVAGTYSVGLTATDKDGGTSPTATATVTASNPLTASAGGAS